MPMYPIPTLKKLAWDVDGTVLICYQAGVAVAEATLARKQFLNGETAGNEYDDTYFGRGGLAASDVSPSTLNANGTEVIFAFVFPHAVDITDFRFYGGTTIPLGNPTPHVKVAEYSTNSTNGIDGTWTAFGNNGVISWDETNFVPWVLTPLFVPSYRTITSHTASSVKALRLRCTVPSPSYGRFPDMASAHIFGDYSAAANPDRLEIWDPTVDAEIAAGYFDWTEIARGSVAQKTFRVKNRSATLTANSTAVTVEQNTAMVPSQITWHDLSADGSSWSSSVALGNLAPGAISPVTYVRRQPPSNAQFGLGAVRLVAHPSSWS